VEQKYKRIENLDEKIKNISLPYMDWKVLFMVTEDSSVADIVDFLKEESDVVKSSLDSLEGKELIEKFTGEIPVAASEEEKQATANIEEIDFKEEEFDEAPIEDETKIQVSEVVEDSQKSEDELVGDALDFDEKTGLEDETPEDDETIMPELKEEDADEEDLQSVTEPETKAAAEDTTGSKISESELVPEMDTLATEPAAEPAKPDEETQIDSRKQSIMVIDDSIVIRKMIEIALEDEDFNIFSATTGKEGMEAIEKDKPDLVILDMMLPDMSGIDVLKKIKDSKDLPVIMLSGKDSPQLVENAKEMGVNDFLPKPFKDDELVEKVKSLVKSK